MKLSSLLRKVVVRFAPSPTGDLHLGGARTALINYLHAKGAAMSDQKDNNKFLLRIEDTDRSRIVVGAVEKIIDDLQWLGIESDSDPVVQSTRLPLYQRHCDQLIHNNLAYRCFCDGERLESIRRGQTDERSNGYDNRCRHLTSIDVDDLLENKQPFSVRFRFDIEKAEFRRKVTTWQDVVHGRITHAKSEGDFVILKSDGFPTYHLSNVVDDREMEVTDVIRGAEWISSTPKHLALFDAFEWRPPRYAHLPLMTLPGGKKLSKRHQVDIGDDEDSCQLDGVYNIQSLRQRGIYPEAIIWFLLNVGGLGFHGNTSNYTDYRSKEWALEQFQLSRVSSKKVNVDLNQLKKLNRVVLSRRLSTDVGFQDALDYVVALAKERKRCVDGEDVTRMISALLNEIGSRLTTLNDIVMSPTYSFLWKWDVQHITVDKQASSDDIKMLPQFVQAIKRTKNVDAAIFECEGNVHFNSKSFGPFVRYVLTSNRSGLPIKSLWSILGHREFVHRLELFCNRMSNVGGEVDDSVPVVGEFSRQSRVQ